MADYDLKYTGAQIDGLLATANELKTNGYIYKGVATPSTNPGTPTERVAYLASESGTYTNFGGIVITSGLYSLTYAGGTWTGTQMSAGSDIEVVQTTGDSTTDVMSQKAVTDELNDINIKTANKANTDLDIADEYGNVLVKFANGHVRTKNFDSSKVSQNGGIINSLTSNNNAKAISSMTDPLLDNIASAYYYQKGEANKDFDYGKKVCIITAGQSNARGATRDSMPSALSSALPIQNCHFVENQTYEQSSYNAAPFEDFYAFSYSHQGRYLPDRWGFDAQLYYDIAVRDSQEFYVIKTAQGDTSIDPNGFGNGHWSADYEKVASGIKLIREFEKNIKVHVNNYGGAFNIRAFVWHQGEGDRSTSSGEEYYDNLKNVFAYIRGVVGNNQLPIIIGGISHLSSQWTQAVEDAQLRIYNEDPNVYYIDMSGAPLHSYDTFHFSQASCVYLGDKVHDILVELGIVASSKINPTRPW